jgi:hypothetical protein
VPTFRSRDVRWRYGTYTSSSITSTYSWVNYTVQSDQTIDNQTAVEWIPPYQMLPPEYARINALGDPDGWLVGVFGPIELMTFGQMSYVLSTNFPGGIYKAAGSLMVYDKSGTAVYLNATMHRPIIGQDMEPRPAGWGQVKFRYDFGVVVS